MAEPMLKLEGRPQELRRSPRASGDRPRGRKGEVVCVLGPSGSGKSTLLRCINLLEPPDEGEILLEGIRHLQGASGKGAGWRRLRPPAGRDGLPAVQPLPAQDRDRERLPRQRTVLGRGAARPGRRPRTSSKRVGLADKLDEYPDRLSGRPAAAGGDRPGAGDGPPRDALRRGHQRPRSGADQGGARRDARAGGGGHDDGRRHPRDGLRPGRRRPRRLHGRGVVVEEGMPSRCSTTRRRSGPSASSG